MDYTYLPHRSKIIDFLEVPMLLSDQRDEDYTRRERQIFEDVLKTKAELCQELKALEADLNKFYLTGQLYSLAYALYIYGLDQGRDPQSMDEVLEDFGRLTESELEACLRQTLRRNYLSEEERNLPLLELLELVDLPPEVSWHWYQAIKNPQKLVEGLVKVLRQVAEIYQPYYDRYEAERQEAVEKFDLDAFLAGLPMEGEDVASQYGVGYELLLLSPIHMTLALHYYENYQLPIFIVLTPRVEELLVNEKELELETFISLLKTISDESRYQVLKALIEPHAKNKEIAQTLGITTAAVSFHTQKLINSQLVLINNENKEQKYKVNKPLLKEMIEKLRNDFNLED